MPSARSNLAGVLGMCLALSGCADYLAHRDSVTFGLGDAPQANIGIQAIKPFPPEAWDTDIDGDGRVVARAQRDYVAGPPPKSDVPPTSLLVTTPAPGTNGN